jgi:ribosomal protein RSM22 (predicted rRNA methylase)
MISLPTLIETVISDVLAQANPDAWTRRAVELSEQYRGQREKRGVPFIFNYLDVLAYLALRIPSTYSHIFGALSSIKELSPTWTPKSILDIGTGPGVGVWAAKEVFSTIQEAVLYERDQNFVDIGQKISETLDGIQYDWQQVDISKSLPILDQQFDLVILSSVINELNEKTRSHILDFAGKVCRGVILIVEPGTPIGFEAIQFSYKRLKRNEGVLVAPYIDNTFVNSADVIFAQKMFRPEFQRRIRQLQRKQNLEHEHLLPASDWEESKYYYLAYSQKEPEIRPAARVIDKPKVQKASIELKLLTKDGVKVEKVLKREREKFKQAKKLEWGDIVGSW